MTSLARFPTSDGASVYVSVSDDDPGLRRVAKPGEVVATASQTIEDALACVRPAMESVVLTARSLSEAPKEVSVSLGIELSVEVGAVIAKGQTSANVVVTLKWER